MGLTEVGNLPVPYPGEQTKHCWVDCPYQAKALTTSPSPFEKDIAKDISLLRADVAGLRLLVAQLIRVVRENPTRDKKTIIRVHAFIYTPTEGAFYNETIDPLYQRLRHGLAELFENNPDFGFTPRLCVDSDVATRDNPRLTLHVPRSWPTASSHKVAQVVKEALFITTNLVVNHIFTEETS